MTESSANYAPVEAKWARVLDYDRPTPREWQVLKMVVNGMDNQQIAAELDIKPASVNQAIIRINEKLRCIEGIGERMNSYATRGQITGLLIAEGFFAEEQPR